MKNRILILLAGYCLFLSPACKDKSSGEKKEAFIPVLSIINAQLADIDTSLYSIIRINIRDNMPADTEYIKRENIRFVAKDFLDMPELSRKRYTEENIPGPTDNLSTISYRPIDPDKEEIQRVDLIIDPRLSETGDNVISSIFIDRIFSNRDSAVQKKMLWRINKSFQVTTIRQTKESPETTSTYKVIWNEDETY